MNFISNMSEKFRYLQEDFIGIQFDLSIFSSFIIIILFCLIFFLLLYLVGEKIRNFSFPKTDLWSEKHYINIAMGYIAFCSGLTLIGFSSLLTPFYLGLYLFATLLFITFPLRDLKRTLKELIILIVKMTKVYRGFQFWQRIILAVFIIICFFRLLPPEIGADAMNYHTTFPKLYLFYETIRLDPAIHVAPIAIPQLGEMPYILTVFFNLVDASRYIHFGFYMLCVLLLFSTTYTHNKNELNFYVVLLLVSSPLVLHYAPSAYSDFAQLFCFLLTIFLLIKEKIITKSTAYLSGIIMGGALATKAFAILYLPSLVVFILYRLYKNKNLNLKTAASYVFPFIIIALLFPLPWYIHSFMLFGNPSSFYVFNVNSSQPSHVDFVKLFITSFNWFDKLTINHFFEYSPLIIFGIVGTILTIKNRMRESLQLPINTYIILFLAILLFYPPPVYSGRYFLPVFTLLSILLATGLQTFNKNVYAKYLFNSLVTLLIIYFGINTIAITPYGMGWAKKENYITRALLINRTAYYDFNNEFSKHISTNEIVATYNLDQFYYSSFIPNSAYLFFQQKNISLSVLREHRISKLLIRGGDITWFCKNLEITDCGYNTVSLLTSDSMSEQYLYEIKER